MAIGIAALLFIFACRKEQKNQNDSPHAKSEKIQDAFSKSGFASQLSLSFNDSLICTWEPDWESMTTDVQSDTVAFYSFPLTAMLHSKTGKAFPLHESNYTKFLVANKAKDGYSFSVATVLREQAHSGDSTFRQVFAVASTGKVLFQDLNKHVSVASFNSAGWITERKNARSDGPTTMDDPVCVYVCNYGYWCMTVGYTATVTVGINSCAPPPPPAPCPTTSYGFGYTAAEGTPVWSAGPSEVNCNAHPPGWAPQPDPTLFPAPTGNYVAGSRPPSMPVLPDIRDNFWYICPQNFTFVSVTTNDLWQEAAISNIYCTVANSMGQQKQLLIPVMYFGLPYYNVTGSLRYSKQMAMNLCADAFNYGEYKMRRYFFNFPNATAAQLADKWVQEANNEMTRLSNGSGRASRTGSLNPAQVVTPRAYIGCVEPPK